GHCTCKTITFSIQAPPLITHCCHCTSCQRESGSAFAINCVVETYNFTITSPASPVIIGVPSLSSPTGDKHLVAHCAKCFTALYAHYSANKSLMFVKVGALDDDSRTRMRPDVHIFTSTKVEWVDLRREEENGVKVYEEYYRREEVWSEESLRRREVLL
ncbi:Mss4-like protein, partial [Pyrenochaeta sp. MPI-SDFR-AT-0127]